MSGHWCKIYAFCEIAFLRCDHNVVPMTEGNLRIVNLGAAQCRFKDERSFVHFPNRPSFFVPCLVEKKTPRKPSISGWKKPMTKKLKWKRVPSDELLFNLSLLPRRDGAALAPRTDCDATRDVQEELKKLEEELWVIEDAKAAEAEEETGKENVECMVDDNALWTNFVEEEDFEDDVDLAFYEDKVSPQVLTSLEHFRDNRASKRLRRKLKWRHQKAHRAVKTKHWNLKNMVNKPHGRKLYIHHRLHVSVSFSPHYLPTPHHLKRTVIDSKGFEIVKKSKGRTEKKFNNVKCNSRAFRAAGREHPIAQPVPAYALRANNADGALDNDLVNVLINLQNRDLTPEDYELLLRLDERVAPQTVTQDVLDGFRTDVASESDTHQECAVCMETYQVGQGRKHLPCGHVFHAHCIDTWLSNSSLNCPLDGLSVECC